MPLNLIAPVMLLALSNLIMNVAWYGHLKLPREALWLAILVSWGIAFFEYCLAVPANRIGAKSYSLPDLKVLQEVCSLGGFVVVAWLLFGERPGPSQIAGFIVIAGGAWMIIRSPFG